MLTGSHKSKSKEKDKIKLIEVTFLYLISNVDWNTAIRIITGQQTDGVHFDATALRINATYESGNTYLFDILLPEYVRVTLEYLRLSNRKNQESIPFNIRSLKDFESFINRQLVVASELPNESTDVFHVRINHHRESCKYLFLGGDGVYRSAEESEGVPIHQVTLDNCQAKDLDIILAIGCSLLASSYYGSCLTESKPFTRKRAYEIGNLLEFKPEFSN